MKTKDSKETVRAFLFIIAKKNRPKKIWVDKGTKFVGEFEKLCKAEGIQIYSMMSETKFAIAERTIRSLKHILYRYMEDHGYNYIYQVTQFLTTIIFRSTDLIPKNVKSSEFCPFCTANHYENLENPTLKLETEFASRSMT